ncbi:MAG: TonB-dependent receptor [Beijerinckiaceae bacterium]|nr:TonB-dependent receptor [Beijerinckiaceae bacterium]
MIRLGRLSAFVSIFSTIPTFAFSQPIPEERELAPEIVITATRSPLEVARSGSATSVIDSAQIEAYGVRNIADALRLIPGVDVSEQGGAGGLSIVRVRGSEAGQTLVLMDGIRIGDPSSTAGEFNFASIALTNIDRIEVLRGPQSALYGSDAMGGVVNIITRKGSRTPSRSLTIEGGSYGTIFTRAEMSGATDVTSYAFAISGFHTDGFSSYGYRIPRIEANYPGGMERDKSDKIAGSARVSHKIGDLNLDVGLSRHQLWLRYDDPSAYDPDPSAQIALRDTSFNRGKSDVTTAFVKASTDTLDGRMRHALTLYGNWNNRTSFDSSCYDEMAGVTVRCRSKFNSRRFGLEYQGDIKLGALGTLIIGGRTEREEAENRQDGLGESSFAALPLAGSQSTHSAFVLHQFSLGSRLDLSLGARVDAVESVEVFPTWRATLAYRLFETDTKLRASSGTGAKAPSLYQRFSEYGNLGLKPEENFGYDFGFDQRLFDGRVNLSATWFDTRYKNLIDIDWSVWPYRYYNIAEARIKGLETSAEFVLVPGEWKARLSYTYSSAINETTGQPLPRRPKNKGGVSLTYTGIPKVELEARALFVGERLDSAFAPGVFNSGYLRIDMRGNYRINENLQAFLRLENITNERYEEVLNYGVAGRSVYAGLKVSW